HSVAIRSLHCEVGCEKSSEGTAEVAGAGTICGKTIPAHPRAFRPRPVDDCPARAALSRARGLSHLCLARRCHGLHQGRPADNRCCYVNGSDPAHWPRWRYRTRVACDLSVSRRTSTQNTTRRL